MTTQPEEPVVEEPATEEVVKAEIEENPLTVQEAVERVREIGHTAKYGILRPGWDFIRRALDKADEKTDRSIKGFFDGFKGQQDEDKK